MSNEIAYIESEIADQFLNDESDRPWIIGFSGGKDSTMLLQLVWNAVARVPEELRSFRKIYVVCNDTLVENPRIINFIDNTLDLIQKSAVSANMPITVHKTIPRLEETFWVNFIGKGYPAPNNLFRWCTERLKINPTTRFILDKVKEDGEVIILLGTRSDESSQRAKSIKKHYRKGKRLRKHMLPKAFVYAPISDILTNDLWQYLMQVSPPWGGTHKELVTLYKNANSGDCPLVIDTTTPSCGNSRFGCWVCTVVNNDKSMEGLIENGEDWMMPLFELRHLFKQSRDRHDWRQTTRRNGLDGVGPYLPHVRALFLEKLLSAQKIIQDENGPIELISHQELVAVQLAWYRDSIFDFKVSEIYNRIYQTEIDMGKHESKLKEEEVLLKKACGKNEDDFELIQNLISLQRSKTLMIKKRGLQADIENTIERFVDKANKAVKK